MTHKISPISFRLGVSSSWLSTSHFSPLNLPFLLHSDFFLRTLIQGVFFKFSLFVSPIIILRSPSGALHINLFFWDATSKTPHSSSSFFLTPPILSHFSKPSLVSAILYKIITKLFNSPQGLYFHFSQIPSPIFNAQILSDYLAYRISLDPYFHKSLVLEALRAANSPF